MIYLDNAATTQMSEDVIDIMQHTFHYYGNPSSMHKMGEFSRELIKNARRQVAELINADPEEIYFTSGGTESNNWALRGCNVNRVITSKIEHPSILETCSYLSRYSNNFVDYVNVDKCGLVNLEQLEIKLKWCPTPSLVSIMMANNEIGTIQPIKEISNLCKKYEAILHTDAVQAFGHIPIDVKKLGVDMLSVSAHKIHGPKGIGCLYIRKGLKVNPLICGGGQEKQYRSGTENLHSIAGFGMACKNALDDLNNNVHEQISELSNYFSEKLSEIGCATKNSKAPRTLPNIVNFSFDSIPGEELVTMLSYNDICCSTGSACHADSDEPSHVLRAIGLHDDLANSSIRFSLSKYTTKEEIDTVLQALKYSISTLR